MYDKKNLPISEAHMPSRINFLKIAGISLLLFCTTSQIAVADSYEKNAVTATQQSKTEENNR